MEIEIGADGRPRCAWGTATEDYVVYHDEEWGRPTGDERDLFEKMSLEGFQSGLSWLTILRRRDGFRRAFAGFDPEIVAGYDDADVERLVGDASIIRHRGKIRSVINNARRVLELRSTGPTLPELIWSFEPQQQDPTWVATTPESVALAKELKRRGFTFVGGTTMYALMQACGVVNDHASGCHVREAVAAERAAFPRPGTE